MMNIKWNNIKHYMIQMEVESLLGIFCRPDSGSEQSSYPVPTPSAIKGMIECILFLRSVEVVPLAVGICREPEFISASFNASASPLRKDNVIKSGNSTQISRVCLYRPCYKILAMVEEREQRFNAAGKMVNVRHEFQARFNKRLKRGQMFRRPCMGVSDFPVTYVGPWRDSTKVCEELNLTVPRLLKTPFTDTQFGDYDPEKSQYLTDVKVENGVLFYANHAA